jgi:hypothetical protein
MAAESQQRRIILHLRYGAAEPVTIRTAAELAHMLGLALHGVFLQDAALTELTALPFVREFRLATGVWQKLDQQRIAEEQRAAVNEARRLFNEAATSFGVAFLFDIASGEPHAFVASTSRAGDIIVVAQPRLPAEQLAHVAAGWLETAHSCDASVMLVPQVLARTRGTIAAVVCAEGDPALAIAVDLAVAAEESLLLLVSGLPDLATRATARARSAGLPASRIVVRSIAGTEPEDVVNGLGAVTERLVVLTRGACGMDDAAVSSHIATSRSVPVLVECH